MNRDDFNKLRDIAPRERDWFIRRTWKLRYLGSGGSRHVYDLGGDGTRVLKVATELGGWGERQMEKEIDVFTSPDAPNWLPAIYDYDDIAFSWSVHERVHFMGDVHRKMKIHPEDLLWSGSPFAQEVQKFTSEFNICRQDVVVERHWGVSVKDERVCLVDYGF